MKLEDYKYDITNLPTSWKPYFEQSEEGKTYKCLINDKGDLVMSNTELEIESNQEILDKAYGDVLLIGLGINLINDKVLNLDKVNSVDTIEISDYVISNVKTKTNIIKGDYLTHKFDKNYDVIWHDPYCDSPNAELLREYLKPGGVLLSWNPSYKKQ